jgi:pyruvate,water dikinase
MPLAGGIVECRGGMLVHGAIIAREYGIPCVTGVPNALSMIDTGAQVQVDGYLGVVTIG